MQDRYYLFARSGQHNRLHRVWMPRSSLKSFLKMSGTFPTQWAGEGVSKLGSHSAVSASAFWRLSPLRALGWRPSGPHDVLLAFYLFVPSPFLPRTLIWDKSAQFPIMESAGMSFSKALRCEYRCENTNVVFSPMALLSLGVSLTPFTQALPNLWQASCSWHLIGKGLFFVVVVCLF